MNYAPNPNLVEQQAQNNHQLQEENQALKDEINRLKGEKGKNKTGYRSVVKQNIKFTTDNVEYQLERYYSSGERKLYEAELPEDVRNSEFGSELKAFIAYLYFAGRVTANKIRLSQGYILY
jgi:predicted RNase H-like nuclease (RuvC/YqgF family)